MPVARVVNRVSIAKYCRLKGRVCAYVCVSVCVCVYVCVCVSVCVCVCA